MSAHAGIALAGLTGDLPLGLVPPALLHPGRPGTSHDLGRSKPDRKSLDARICADGAPEYLLQTKFGKSELDHGTRNLDGGVLGSLSLRSSALNSHRPMFIKARAAQPTAANQGLRLLALNHCQLKVAPGPLGGPKRKRLQQRLGVTCRRLVWSVKRKRPGSAW